MDVSKTVFGEMEAVKAGDKMVIRGYASVFGNLDLQDEIVNPKAFSSIPPLEELHFLHQHNWGRPIGKFDVLNVDDHGLYYEASVDETEVGLFTKVKNGLIKGASFLAGVADYRYIDHGGKNVRELTALSLKEISIVTRGANPLASSAAKALTRTDFFHLASKLGQNDRRELVKMLTIDPVDKTELEELSEMVSKFTNILKGE